MFQVGYIPETTTVKNSNVRETEFQKTVESYRTTSGWTDWRN